jgi:hypothetical protein
MRTRAMHLLRSHALFDMCVSQLCLAFQRKQGRLDEAALEAVTKALSTNGEYYSMWNYRRRILLHLFHEKFASFFIFLVSRAHQAQRRRGLRRYAQEGDLVQ